MCSKGLQAVRPKSTPLPTAGSSLFVSKRVSASAWLSTRWYTPSTCVQAEGQQGDRPAQTYRRGQACRHSQTYRPVRPRPTDAVDLHTLVRPTHPVKLGPYNSQYSSLRRHALSAALNAIAS